MLKPSPMLVGRNMMDDLAQLRERAAEAVARTRDLIETADAAALCAESVMVVDEARFRRIALR